MKKLTSIILITIFISIVGFIVHKEIERKNHIPDFLLGQPEIDSIRVERHINGKILPVEEIKIKSKINGIVEKVYVEIGQKVKVGQKIAVIRNLSEPLEIENLKTTVNLYEIQLETAKLNYDREKNLASSGLSSRAEFESVGSNYNEIIEQLSSARKRLQMATSGMNTDDKDLSNIIYAPAAGTVLTLVSRSGSPVIKQNSYNEGTTLATIANMDSLKFFGKIFERDMKNIFEKQPLQIETIYSDVPDITGYIDKVYPKGEDENGIVKFPIEAVINKSNVKLWGGMNATAIIETDRKDSVLCIQEKFLVYENDSCYAYIKSNNDEFVKTAIQTGISDGIKTEIISGLTIHNKVKLPIEN